MKSFLKRALGRGGNGLSPTQAFRASTSDKLFEGDDKLFKSLASECRTYFEYGCGASTRWIMENTDASIHATDTSGAWIKAVSQQVPADATDRVNLIHVDLGPLMKWGRPTTYTQRHKFSDYTDQMWKQSDTAPDLVLVDGRFRVCCFLTSLRNAKPGTNILFDDYMNRPRYHLVEEFAKRMKTCGRQALFVAPEKGALDLAKLDAEIAAFRYVMD